MRILPPLVIALLLAPSAAAWVAGPDRPHHADLAVLAAQRLPPEMRDLLLAHEAAFRKGALDPDGISDPERDVHTFYHAYSPADGGGGGVYRVQLSLHEATKALRENKSGEDVAYQMGFLTHFVTDLAVPFHSGAGHYDSAWHEEYERATYDRRDEYGTGEARAPREIEDVEAYAIALAERSAADADALERSLTQAAAPWTPEARDITERSATLAVEAAADMLYTAFVLADPAREAPPRPQEMPRPTEPEDLGLSLAELQKHYPVGFVLAISGLVLAGVTAGILFARQRAKRV